MFIHLISVFSWFIFFTISSETDRNLKQWATVSDLKPGCITTQSFVDTFNTTLDTINATPATDGNCSTYTYQGKAWVNGDDVRVIEVNNGVGWTDGTRTFRLQWKPKEKKWKANFQENTTSATGKKTEVKNVHMDITDKTPLE